MKIVQLLGPMTEDIRALMDELDEHGFRCVWSQGDDEVDQAGKQAGKVVLLFTDPKYGYEFLSTCHWTGFSWLSILYLSREVNKVTVEEEVFSKFKLKVFTENEKEKLISSLSYFFQGTDV